MKKLLSLVLVASMLLSMVAVIPMNISAADESKLSTQAEAYYFGGEVVFNELYGPGTTKEPYQYYGEEVIREGSNGKTLTIDGVIDEGEWGNPSFTVSSDYAASNNGLTTKTNEAFEEPAAENSYFYYNKDSYKYSSQYVKTPIEEGMSYTVYLMWDEDFLYLAADVYDITGHTNSNIDNNIWNGDAFQFRVDKDGSYTRADGYNADGGKDADGNHVTIQPWHTSVYKGGTEFTTEVPNFVMCYSSGNGGTTIIRDNANRYYPHEVMVDDPDSEVETDMIAETQYCDIDISYAMIFEDVCETYDDYKASNFGGQAAAVSEWGPAYAVAKPVKQSGTKYVTQYEVAIPWVYIDDASDFLAEAGDEFGFATMLLDRQTGLSTSFGSFLEWGNGINNHRAYHDHATCNGSNSLVLSATSYDARTDYHEHTYAEANCAQPETCTVCGYQRGFKTGHDYELTAYKLPTPGEDGYVKAKCLNATCEDPYVERTLEAASEEVYKWVDRNDGVVDLSSRLSSAYNEAWTQISWSQNPDDGSWTPTDGAVVYNVDGENAGSAKNMLWLKGQKRPEVISNKQVEVSSMVNPYDFTVLDLTCMSETGTYFHIYDFKGKNSAVSVDVNIWNRLTQAEREMEGETGYHDTLTFWFGPNLIEYAAGLYIIEDKDDAGVVTDTNYYFAITTSGLNGSDLSIAEFEDMALAYKEVDPSVIGIGNDEWHNMTFFVDYDANAALLFWDGELAVGEYDYHFELAEGKSTADPILRVFNLELCLTDLRAGEAGLAAKYVNVGGDDTPDTDPIETDPVETDPVDTDPVDPVLGSYENPYLVNVGDTRVAVSIPAGETAYVKATDANNTKLTVGYATGSYEIYYLRQQYVGAGEDNSTSFTMVSDVDTFGITNTSEEMIVAYLALEAGEVVGPIDGTMDNPKVLTVVEGEATSASAELAAGNMGYFYQFTAPADGTINVTVGADTGWMYAVNNLTAGTYGDNHWSDDDPVVNPETIEVTAGDVIQIIVGTYDPANMWAAPAGTVSVEVAYAAEGPALGSYENPYLLNLGDTRLAVTVPAGTEAYVKVDNSNNTVVTAGYATTAGYMINYVRQTILPEGADNAASFTMVDGFDIFSIYNTSETEDVTVYLALAEGGSVDTPNGPDNPEVLEFAPDWFGNMAANAATELAAGNMGYWYQLTAYADGILNVNVSAIDADWNGLGWTYCVNNLTTGIYGDYVEYDGNPDVYMEGSRVEVSEGDVIQIFATTFNPADMWNAPAGTVNVNVTLSPGGAPDNPADAVLGENTATVEEGSQGYFYSWTATEKGTVTITMNDAAGWTYNVYKTPADIEDYANYYYGDTHWSDDETVVASESVEVEAGDVVTIMVNTYDPANMWAAPAGSVNWTLSFEEYKEPAFDGTGVLYTLSGEIVNGQLIAKLDLSDNDEGILLAVLDLVYNTDALKFVSADAANSVFTAPDMSLMEEGRVMIYGEGDMTSMVNTYANGEVVTLVFDILDPTANFNFDLVARDGDEANHANIDADWNPAVVKFTFETAEDMPENGVLPEPEDFVLGVTGTDVEGKLHVTLDLAANPGIWSLGFALEFNAAALELAGNGEGVVFTADDMLISAGDGVVNFFACNEAAIENITANGTLVTLVFNVLDYDADYGINVTYDAGNVINVDGEEVELTVEIGEIAKIEPTTVTVTIDGVAAEYAIGATVTLDAPQILKDGDKHYVFMNWTAEGVELSDATAMELTFVVPANDVVITSQRYLHGDVNNDGKVNNFDVLEMTKIIKKLLSSEGKNADVKMDGKINNFDSIAMKQVVKKIFDYSAYEVVEVTE